MPLINCPACGKGVSDQAVSCIHCGHPLKQNPSVQSSSVRAGEVKKGRQRSKLRNDMGSAIAFVGIIIAVIAGAVSGSFAVGIIAALVFTGIGIWIAYGS